MLSLFEKEREDIENEIIFLLEEYLEENTEYMYRIDFQEKMVQEIYVFLEKEGICQGWILQEYLPIIELYHWIEDIQMELFKWYFIPERSSVFEDHISLDSNELYIFDLIEKQNISQRLNELMGIELPLQRSKEWYEYRYQLFSASNLWKLFSTECQKNSLIYEKCKPIEYSGFSPEGISNFPNPRNWGIKYEPLSIMIYEFIHNTKVNTKFGCIQHSKYSFIGASPDGINISIDCPEKYGHMVEVKNIYNREIEGIPSEEYWIQMQIQMETCNLEKCDFLETRFKEYPSVFDFYNDIISEYKGVILYFLPRETENTNQKHVSMFQYMPLYVQLDKRSIEWWIQEIQEKYIQTHILYETTYWYLDEYSCVLVKRNTVWFEKVLPIIQNAWTLVEKERNQGYQHRAPAFRKKTTISFTNPTTTSFSKMHLIKLDEHGNIL
jgi:hypothetical protein